LKNKKVPNVVAEEAYWERVASEEVLNFITITERERGAFDQVFRRD